MTDCGNLTPGEVIPPECRPYRGFTEGGAPPQVLPEQTYTTLEARGVAVPQTAAETEAERWRVNIRAASNPVTPSWFRQLGGDWTDGETLPNGDRIIIGSDIFAGATVVSDLYVGSALPVRNALLYETPAGTFNRQNYLSGNSGVMWEPNQGSHPGRWYWPIACEMDPGNVDRLMVAAWLVNTATATAPYGRLEDTHLLSCSLAFGGAVAQTFAFGHAGAGPHLLKFWPDATHIYSLWEDFYPDYDPAVAGPTYGQGDYDEVRHHHTRVKLARCTHADFDVIANWRWWDGSTWVVGNATAVYLRDVDGYPIPGDLDVTQVADGTMRMVSHALTDDHVTVWSADTITGPWTPIARVRALGMGTAVNGGIQVGQFVRFVEHVAAPAEHSVVALALNLLNPTGVIAGRNIRRYAPQFVVVPHYP